MDNEKFQELILSKFDEISKKFEQNDKFQVLALSKFDDMSKKFEQIDKFQESALNKFDYMTQQLKLLADSIDTLAVKQEMMQQDITNVRQSQVRLEQDLNKKITALFDFRDSQLETNKLIFDKLDQLAK